jgi:phosphohistidine phosphatase
MIVYLIRHAKAFDRDASAWPDDRRRPLTAAGRRSFARLARRLARAVPTVELLESSRFTRAWQTAKILQEEAGWPEPSRLEGLEEGMAGGDPGALRRSLAAMGDLASVAWVGHEPLLGRLASTLLSGEPDAVPIAFKKGAVLAIEFDPAATRGGGRLRWMLTPGVSARIGKR